MNHLGRCSVLSSHSLRPNAVAGHGGPAYSSFRPLRPDGVAGREEPAYKDCIAGHGGPAYSNDQNCWTMGARWAGRAGRAPTRGCPIDIKVSAIWVVGRHRAAVCRRLRGRHPPGSRLSTRCGGPLLRGPALRDADAVEERLFSLMPMGTHKGMPLPEQSNRLLFYSSIRRSTDAATRGQ